MQAGAYTLPSAWVWGVQEQVDFCKVCTLWDLSVRKELRTILKDINSACKEEDPAYFIAWEEQCEREGWNDETFVPEDRVLADALTYLGLCGCSLDPYGGRRADANAGAHDRTLASTRLY